MCMCVVWGLLLLCYYDVDELSYIIMIILALLIMEKLSLFWASLDNMHFVLQYSKGVALEIRKTRNPLTNTIDHEFMNILGFESQIGKPNIWFSYLCSLEIQWPSK